MHHRPVAVLCGGLLACLPLACSRAAPAPTSEESRPSPVQVVAARTVRLGEWTELLGTTTPLPGKIARVTAAVAGNVVAVPGGGAGGAVAEGQHVEAGQVVALLDDREARANRDRLAAVLAEVEEQQQQAAVAVGLADIEVTRLEELVKGGMGGGSPLASRVELEKARLARLDARSKQRALTARLAAACAELRAADTQLGFYALRAPIAGRLGLLQVSRGQNLALGALVAEVVDLEQIDVLCFVPPSAVARLAAGQRARLAVAQGPEKRKRPSDGVVVFVGPQGQPDTGNVPVKVRFPNVCDMRANTVLRVEVETQPETDRLVIPESALREDEDRPSVLVAVDVKTEKDDKGAEERRGKAKKLLVVPGVRARDRGLVEVLRLEESETKTVVPAQGALVVVRGGTGVKDDADLKVEDEAPEGKK
jgi:RND family efflux transporter MFP subunit